MAATLRDHSQVVIERMQLAGLLLDKGGAERGQDILGFPARVVQTFL
jgi:hypothetical protein